MNERKKIGFKKGAASFYVVAFSTLILIVMATSFAALMISEISRTQNDDLAQSAYDSALAGVEDAKLAFYNYLNCVGATAQEPISENINCGNIVYWMENPNCDMVGHMLGRIAYNESGEVAVQESSSAANNMAQYYTCVKIKTSLPDSRGTLSRSMTSKVVKVELDGIDDYSRIKYIKFKWYENGSAAAVRYNNFKKSSGGVVFPPLTSGAATPPTVSIGLVQTSEEFTMDSFDMTMNGQTNRGVLYLVPTNNGSEASTSGEKYIGAYNEALRENRISESGFLKSNDKTAKNLPYAVYCPEDTGDEYMCSVTIELPEPVGGSRNDETFFFVPSLIYRQPSADFSVEFYCSELDNCGTVTGSSDGVTTTNQAFLSGSQIEIDSTGRANDLYRRVEVRLESSYPDAEQESISPLYVMQVLGNDSGDNKNLNKNLGGVTAEYGNY